MSVNHDDTDVTLSPGLPGAQPPSSFSHRVSAIYATRDEAERVRQHLIDGGIAGAVAGVVGNETKKSKQGKFSELVMDVIKSGNVVLVVRTYGEADKALAKAIIGKSLKGHTEGVTESS